MKVSTFVSNLGVILGEDFTYATIWTKAELVGYLRDVLRVFGSITRLVDRQRVRVVNSTTGEATVPDDYSSAFFLQFGLRQLDTVTLSDLDFVTSTWPLNTTGVTPYAATTIGTGPETVIRLVPVPTVVQGVYGSNIITSLKLADSGANIWSVGVSSGALTTTSSSGTGLSVVIGAPTTYWDLGVTLVGELTLTANLTATSADLIYLSDAVTSVTYSVEATDAGELDTRNITYGRVVAFVLDDVYQTFTAGVAGGTDVNYGMIVDAHATGVSATPSTTIRRDSPRGRIVYARTGESSVMVWYRGLPDDVANLNAELFVDDAFIPVLSHGVLSLAYGHDGAGRDPAKAQLLWSLFTAECETLKRIFGKR